MKLDLSLRVLRLQAYMMGDMGAAMSLFERDIKQSAADGAATGDAVKAARRTASRGIGSVGINATAFLLFCVLDGKLVEQRWPTLSLAWFALWASAAMMFALHYYTVTGSMGWRRAWYRVTGDPRIEDTPLRQVPPPLARQLSFWKTMVRLSGHAGALILLAAMAAIFVAPTAWDTPGFLWAAVLSVVAVYWPNVYLSAVNQAYHQMMAARVFSGRAVATPRN